MADTATRKGRKRHSFSILKRPHSLRQRLALWNVLIFFLAFLLLESVVFLLVTSYMRANLDDRLYTQSEKIRTTANIWLSTGHQFDERFYRQLARGTPGDEFTADKPTYIKLLDPRTGKSFYHSANLNSEHLTLSRADVQSALHGQKILRTYVQGDRQQVRTLTFPLQDANHTVVAIVQVGLSQDAINGAQNNLLLIFGVGTVAAALLAYVVGMTVTRRELRPLSDLSSTLYDLSADGLGVSLAPASTATEIQQLTEAFNRMTKRLEASFRLQRDFVADISHELRTPLTTIRGQVDILLLDPQLQGDAYQDVRRIQTELARVSRLLTNLFIMARAEVGILPELDDRHVQVIEVDTLLVEALRQLGKDRQEVALEIEKLEQAHIRGDSDLLKQMIMNIVENALQNTPAGGRVLLELSATHDLPDHIKGDGQDNRPTWIVIRIRDTGKGIAAEDLPHIFVPYYRAKQTGARGKYGAGLGLFIARLIAQAHNGDISVESEAMKGASFLIRLPGAQYA